MPGNIMGKKPGKSLFLPMLLLFVLPPMGSMAADAHVHGSATLDIAVEETHLTMLFNSPLFNLIGFEHAPHDEAELEAVRYMAKTLYEAEGIFMLTPEAGCKLQHVHLESPVLEPGLLASSHSTIRGTHEHDDDHEHAELDGEFVFQCTQGTALSGLEVHLFDRFPALQRIDVQLITADRQSAARLTPADRKLVW